MGSCVVEGLGHTNNNIYNLSVSDIDRAGASDRYKMSSSMLAAKYQRYGFVHLVPFEPGERGRVMKEMERTMKGYKELRQEVEMARQNMKEMETARNNGRMEKNIQTSYYKSPVGTRTTKLSGSLFHTQYTAKDYFFSHFKCVIIVWIFYEKIKQQKYTLQKVA